MKVVSLPLAHVHEWRLAEVEYVDFIAVRRVECTCGSVDYAEAS